MATVTEPEAAAPEHTDQFRLLVETVRDYAIFLLDADGYVRSWNAGAERIKGYTATEIIGRHFSSFYLEEAVRSGHPDEELRIAAADGRYEEEGWRVRKDGSRFWANVVITALRDPSGELVGFAKVTRDLTERKKAEEHRAKLLAAEEAVAIRDEFLRVAAHELRTPLTGAKMGVQILRRSFKNVKLTAGQTNALDTIGAQVNKLSALVGRLLDTTRLEAGVLPLERVDVDLVKLVSAGADLWRMLSDRHEIVVTCVPERLIARVDPLRVEEVLSNLVDNAIKYSPAGGRIEVSLDRDENAAIIRVRDHGLGVAPEHRSRLFERFYQAHRDRSGMGLGLHITRSFVEMHGGTISVDFPEDGGTRFVVRLPLA
jgi:PAS domain S-box-containing protein